MSSPKNPVAQRVDANVGFRDLQDSVSKISAFIVYKGTAGAVQ